MNAFKVTHFFVLVCAFQAYLSFKMFFRAKSRSLLPLLLRDKACAKMQDVVGSKTKTYFMSL